MPNWCHNTLVVTGATPAVEDFVTSNRGDESPLSFERAAPIGEWDYDAAVKTWGTKWDARFSEIGGVIATTDEAWGENRSDVWVSGAGDVARYRFETAWSPPVPWMVAASARHPDVVISLTWAEVGHGAAEHLTARAGEITSRTPKEVAEVLTPEEMWF